MESYSYVSFFLHSLRMLLNESEFHTNLGEGGHRHSQVWLKIRNLLCPYYHVQPALNGQFMRCQESTVSSPFGIGV